MNILTVNSALLPTTSTAAPREQAVVSKPEVMESAMPAEASVDESKPVAQAPTFAPNSVRFSLGGDDGEQVIIEIYDAEKGALVRTIPYEAMEEKSKGLVLSVLA